MYAYLLSFMISLSFLTISTGQYVATCHVYAKINNGSIQGDVVFTQKMNSNDFSVRLKIKGLSVGKHGIHVHEKGDLGNGCNNTGPHYNPWNKTHGCEQDGNERHAGDLGNFDISSTGQVTVDKNIPNSNTNIQNFLARAIVIHADMDDCGKGGQPDSLTTGHSGKRIACGVIYNYLCTRENNPGGGGGLININIGLGRHG